MEICRTLGLMLCLVLFGLTVAGKCGNRRFLPRSNSPYLPQSIRFSGRVGLGVRSHWSKPSYTTELNIVKETVVRMGESHGFDCTTLHWLRIYSYHSWLNNQINLVTTIIYKLSWVFPYLARTPGWRPLNTLGLLQWFIGTASCGLDNNGDPNSNSEHSAINVQNNNLG